MKSKFLILPLLLLVYSLTLIEVFGDREATEHVYLTVSFLKVNLITYLDDLVCPDKEPLPSYCFGNTIRISNKLENVGNVNTTGNLSTSVLNTTPVEVQYNEWLFLNVSAGNFTFQNTSYNIRQQDEIGIFNVSSKFSYDKNSSNQSCEFWVFKDIGYLRTSAGEPPKIILMASPGKTSHPPYKLDMWLWLACGNTTVNLTTSTNEPGNWVSFTRDEVILLPTGELNFTEITVNVPNGTNYGTYYGWIYANAYGNLFHNNVTINLTIIVSPVDFYLKTKIPSDKKEVCQGSDVYAEVNITKIAPSGQTELNMTYRILYNGSVLGENKEIIALNDTFNSIIRIPILTVPSNSTLDYHTFLAILQYNGIYLESPDTFKVKSCITPPPTPPGGPGPSAPPKGITTPIKKLVLNLSTNILSVVTGNRTSFVATIENIGSQTIKSVKISIEGIPLNWIEIIPTSTDIPVNGIQGYLVIINVPKDAKTGVYQLKVKAIDDVESNIEILTLVIGENLKQIADLLIKEFEDAKSLADKSLLVENCMDVTVIKIIHDDAQYAYKRSLEEYNKENYAKAINWLEYAIPVERKVIARVDINLEMEMRASNASKIMIPPFYHPENQFIQAQAYYEEKNYEKICDPIEEIRKFIMVGLIFWPLIVIIIVFIVIIFIVFYRRRRKEERAGIMERVRGRLGFSGGEKILIIPYTSHLCYRFLYRPQSFVDRLILRFYAIHFSQ